MYEPGQAILRVLDEARVTLERSYAGRSRQEYVDEYQNYWRGQIPISCFFPKASVIGKIAAKAFRAYHQGKLSFIGVFDGTPLAGYDIKPGADGVLWRLDEPLGPAPKITGPVNLAELQDWYAAQPALKARKWRDAYELLLNDSWLLLAAPNCFLGLSITLPPHFAYAVKKQRIRKTSLPGMMNKIAQNVPIERYSARWSSLQDIVGRNSPAMDNLSKLKIALVGCGTIGSHLARYLVQSGAGQSHPLKMFDIETLAQGNLGRHLLNFSDVGNPKAPALAEELRRFHPQVSVSAVHDDVAPHLDMLTGHDLIIDATGDWNVQSYINEWFITRGEPRPRAMLHSWVFMNGAAVQSFLNLRDQYACFRCLRPAFDKAWRYTPADPNEPLNLQPATCGDGAYVPFTVDVSTSAAALANRAALDFARDEPGYRLRTIVTDIERGRYLKPVSPKPSAHCPACGKLRPFT
jgi:molybdopterin/thiamine biosynthesis adenylyltransferase